MFSIKTSAFAGMLTCLVLSARAAVPGEIMLDLSTAQYFNGATQDTVSADRSVTAGEPAALFWRLDNLAAGRYFLKMKLNFF